MPQPKQLRAKPPDDEMHAYDSKNLERLFGLPASTVRSLTRAGHISPVKRGRRLHYSFQDLLMLRTASALRAANISAQRINRTLKTLRATLPAGAAASNKRSLTALGNQIAIREGTMSWEPDSGQYVLALDLGEEKGGLHVIARQTPQLPPANRADDFYAKAFELEDGNPEAARASYQACLDIDPQFVEARINLGRLLHLAGRLDEAQTIYRFGSKAEPLLAFNLAVLLEDMNRAAGAIAAYREALALDPQLADAHFNLARLHEKDRNAKAALHHLLAYRRLTDRQGT